MANELIKIEAPDYMLAVLKDHPELEGLIGELSAGTSSGPAYPQIKLKGTRFRIVDGDIDQILKTTEITVAILRAKEKPERVFYLGAFNPDEEKSPDCMSMNGVTPDEGCVCKQNPSCEGCTQNAWGTGKNADGTPSKGKACKERKLIVVAPVGPEGVLTDKAFGLSIPPASLTSYGEYISQLKLHGVSIPGLVITTIGFKDDSNFPQLTFKYAGALKPAEAAKAIKLMTSNEVANIIAVPGSKAVLPPPAPPAPEPEPAPEPVVIPPTEEAKKRGRKPKETTTAFGDTTAAEPEPVKEETQQDLPDPAAVAKALGIPGFE